MGNEANVNTKAALNRQVANFTVLYTKLHNFHWYVKGKSFFTLHSKFEKLYNYATETLDEVAERLLTIGGQPVATLKGCLEVSSIAEVEETKTAEQMVDELFHDFKLLSIEMAELMEVAEKEGDQATSDLALGIKSHLEKEMWLLSSYLA